MPTKFLAEKNFSWKINCIFQQKMFSRKRKCVQ